MNYELKHFDTTLIRFSATEDSNTPEIQILWQNEEKKDLFPLDLELSGDGISRWLKHRTIPKNRAYVRNFLSKCGLNLNRPLHIIKVSMGLSLNDCYWVVEEGFDGKFSEYNLYDNRFSRVLALIAFTGYGSSIRISLASCPEFTTNGMLPKCWRRERGQIRLYKGGTAGASNTGYEPYSEFYAYQVAKEMDIQAIPYGLSKWQGQLCSACNLFTSKEYSLLPIGRLVPSGGMKAVRNYYESLGSEFVKALDDMIVLDALIFNTDRHFGNFGFLVENQTNKIVAPAPLFDHGNALFNYAGKDDLQSEQTLTTYADTLLPCVYDDFVTAAKQVLTTTHKEGLRHLLNFKFKKHSHYNLPNHRLKLIEKQIQRRAKELLE
ncbi:MAG: XRE family transcriptional regulator [Oscillospiraceae bacterium]|nr:XRE family transcriptional regulator [Oscillospiraceae bacterium]